MGSRSKRTSVPNLNSIDTEFQPIVDPVLFGRVPMLPRAEVIVSSHRRTPHTRVSVDPGALGTVPVLAVGEGTLSSDCIPSPIQGASCGERPVSCVRKRTRIQVCLVTLL